MPRKPAQWQTHMSSLAFPLLLPDRTLATGLGIRSCERLRWATYNDVGSSVPQTERHTERFGPLLPICFPLQEPATDCRQGCLEISSINRRQKSSTPRQTQISGHFLEESVRQIRSKTTQCSLGFPVPVLKREIVKEGNMERERSC